VISPRLKMIDLNPEHWARLMDLMLPPPGGDPEPAAKAGPLGLLAKAQARMDAATTKPERSTLATSPNRPAVVLHRGGAILRVVQLGGGVLPHEGLASVSTVDLRAFRKAQALPLLAAVDVAELPKLWASFQTGVQLTDDLALQHYAMLKAFKAAIGRGVEVEPRLFGAAPLPPEAMLQKTFDRLLPDRRSFVMYLVDRGSVWTSVIATKHAGDLQLITTHDAIAAKVRFASIGSDAKKVVKEVGRRFEPVHIGLFLPLSVFHELIAGDLSAIARAMAARKAVLDPAPAWLLGLVGAGAAAEAATRTGRFASGLLRGSKLWQGLGAGPAGKAAEKLAQTLSSPLELLGLDPWETLRWGRDWRRRVQLDRSVFEKTK
jgi:hypothetical protein